MILITYQLIIETLISGITVTIVGVLLSNIYQQQLGLPVNLFILGAVLHLIFELLGVNRIYCKSGNACKIKF